MEPSDHLLSAATVADYQRTVAAGAARVAHRVATAERPFSGTLPGALSPRIAAVDLDRPLDDVTSALDELEEVYLQDAVYFHHPRYLAHLNCPVLIPALLGEAVLSAMNSSMDTWDQSAGGTLIERRLVDWTTERLGLGPDADGVFTSGGTQSNLHGLLLAREEACAGTGLPSSELLPRLRILASEVSHFSVQKSAKLLGLSPDSVIVVATDAEHRMRTEALAGELARCRRAGQVVMAVVATAGTTDFGSIDPLPEIADLCVLSGSWLHVDAAYGCGLLASPTRRHLLDGIERADSVTVDFHKSFFQPVSSSALLVRHAATLRHATYYAEYLNPARMAAAAIPNQVDKSLQTTRRFDALKLWLTLRIMGADAVGSLFDEVLDRAAQAGELIGQDPRFEVAGRTRLSTVVFRYLPRVPGLPEEVADAANLHAREALAASGEGLVASTKVAGRHYLKLTLLNPKTSMDDVSQVLDLLAAHAEQHVGDQRGAVLDLEASHAHT